MLLSFLIAPALRSFVAAFGEFARKLDSGNRRCADQTSDQCRRCHGYPFPFVFSDSRIGGGWRHVFEIGQLMDGLGEANTFFGTTKAWMSGTHRPRAGTDIAKQNGRAVGVSFRPLAAKLVQAPALAMSLVTELDRKATGVEVRTALAVLVDQPVVGKFGAALAIQLRQAVESEEVQHRGQEVVRVRRATGNGNDWPVFDNLGNAHGAGRIRTAGRNAAPRRARADGDDGRGTRRRLVQMRQHGFVSNLAIDSAVLGRDRAIDHQQILLRIPPASPFIPISIFPKSQGDGALNF